MHKSRRTPREAEATRLRHQVQDLSASVDELASRIEALTTQMRVERSSGREVIALARSLAIAFDATPAPESHDPRGVGPGEPARVDPTRHEQPKTADVADALETAAHMVDLPKNSVSAPPSGDLLCCALWPIHREWPWGTRSFPALRFSEAGTRSAVVRTGHGGRLSHTD